MRTASATELTGAHGMPAPRARRATRPRDACGGRRQHVGERVDVTPPIVGRAEARVVRQLRAVDRAAQGRRTGCRGRRRPPAGGRRRPRMPGTVRCSGCRVPRRPGSSPVTRWVVSAFSRIASWQSSMATSTIVPPPALAVVGQGGGDAGGEEESGCDVADRDADARRRAVRVAGEAHDAAHGLRHHVEGRPLAQRAGLAEAGGRGVDQVRASAHAARSQP